MGCLLDFSPISVRQLIGKDFEGTLKQLATVGYKTVEMCSPPGYEKSGYASLLKLKASEVGAMIHSAGLGCEVAATESRNSRSIWMTESRMRRNSASSR